MNTLIAGFYAIGTVLLGLVSVRLIMDTVAKIQNYRYYKKLMQCIL